MQIQILGFVLLTGTMMSLVLAEKSKISIKPENSTHSFEASFGKDSSTHKPEGKYSPFHPSDFNSTFNPTSESNATTTTTPTEGTPLPQNDTEVQVSSTELPTSTNIPVFFAINTEAPKTTKAPIEPHLHKPAMGKSNDSMGSMNQDFGEAFVAMKQAEKLTA